MGMDQRLMRPGRRRNRPPEITAPGAQTVSANYTGVTPKNVLNLDGDVSVADANNDTLTFSLAVSHGTLTLNRDTYESGGGTPEGDLWTIRVPVSVGAFILVVDGNQLFLDSSVGDPQTALRTELASEIPGYLNGIGHEIFSTATVSGGIVTYAITLKGDLVDEEDVSTDITDSALSFTTGDGTDDAEIVMEGPPASINAMLLRVAYTPSDDYIGADTLTIDADDGNGGTDEATVAITVEFDPLDFEPLVLMRPSATTVYKDNGVTLSVADDPMQRWTNEGSLGGYFEQTSAGSRPTLKLVNGVYVARAAGAHCMTSSGIDLTGVTGATMVLLMKKSAMANTGYGYFGTFADTNYTNFGGDEANGDIYDSFGSTTRQNFLGPNWMTQWNIYAATSKSGEWTARLNGSEAFTTGTNTVAFTATAVLFSGDAAAAMALLSGDIAFLFIGTLTSGQIAALEAYLQTIITDLES